MNQELSDSNQSNNEVNTFYETSKTMNVQQLASVIDVAMLIHLEALIVYCGNHSTVVEQGPQFYQSLSSAVSQLTNLRRLCLSKLSAQQITNQTVFQILSALPSTSLQDLTLNLTGSSLIESGDASILTNNLSRFINLEILTLNLGSNGFFNGDRFVSIGDCLSQLTSLKHFNLSLFKQQFYETGIISLSDGLSQLQNLECLFLSLNFCLTNLANSQPLAHAISKLSNLTILILELQGNELREQDQECFSQAISSLSNLSNLSVDFRFNHFPAKFHTPILYNISKLTELQKLQVNISDIFELIEIQAISPIIRNLYNLEILKLDLSRFDFSKGSEDLGKAIGNLHNLDTLQLRLSNNTLPNNNSYNNLLSGISKLVNLKSLTIRNYVYSTDFDSDNHLPNCLSMLINLEVLSFSFKRTTKLTAELKSFCIALSKLTRIQSLYLNMPFFIKGSDITNLGKGLETMTNLQELTLILKNTSIRGKEAKDISNSISKLSDLSLFQLRLVCNEKSIPSDFKSIFSELRNLRNLTTINIHEEDDNYYLRQVLIKSIVSLVEIKYFIQKEPS